MRGLCAIMVVALGLCGLTACSSSGKGGGTGKHYSIIYADGQTPTSPEGLSQVDFKNLLEKSSGGRIKVQVHTGGDLGTQPAEFQSLQSGAVQMLVTGNTTVAAAYPAMGAPGAPFLFTSVNQAAAALNGPAGKALEDGLAQKAGLDILAWEFFGEFQILSKSPINNLDDLKGQKVRVNPDATQEKTFSSIGAQPTSADVTEVYSLLQQNAVSVVPDPITVLFSGKYYEVAKYLTTANVLLGIAPILINKKFFDSLPSDLQTDVRNAAQQSASKAVSLLASQEKSDVATMQANGVHVSTLSSQDLATWKAAEQPLYNSLKQQFGSLFTNFLSSN